MLESGILIFDIIALEWLLALLAIAVLFIVGGFINRSSRREPRSLRAEAGIADGPIWHDLSADEVLAQLGGTNEGLSQQEARQR
ncbi:MAG: hypothetical protein WBG92_00490, partial [Thiohalocapsa sp.]